MIVESTYRGSRVNGTVASITDAVVDTFLRWPMRMTGATMDFVLDSVDRLTRSGSSGRSGNGSALRNAYASPQGSTTYESATSSTSSKPSPAAKTNAGNSNGGAGWPSMTGDSGAMRDRDLSGNDLKYVIYSLVFTKPGYECVLQKQQEELVNYAADANTYAALKIAQFLDAARHGHGDKPASWRERGYAVESAKAASPQGATLQASARNATSQGAHDAEQQTAASHGEGWRVPADDQKFIVFLYHVDRRLPRQEEVTRNERVVVERETRIA